MCLHGGGPALYNTLSKTRVSSPVGPSDSSYLGCQLPWAPSTPESKRVLMEYVCRRYSQSLTLLAGCLCCGLCFAVCQPLGCLLAVLLLAVIIHPLSAISPTNTPIVVTPAAGAAAALALARTGVVSAVPGVARCAGGRQCERSPPPDPPTSLARPRHS